MTRIVAISDTHSMHRQVSVPDGDVLIHCGDVTGSGQYQEFADFADWLAHLPHKHKLVTLGNHDRVGPIVAREMLVDANALVLIDEPRVIDGLVFYGSPWTPRFGDWSWMRKRGEDIARAWAVIPDNTDVLVTHGPPYGHGDGIPDRSGVTTHVGCLELLRRVATVQPRLHIFGHIHEGYGRSVSDEMPTLFVNASTCDAAYRPVNAAQVIGV